MLKFLNTIDAEMWCRKFARGPCSVVIEGYRSCYLWTRLTEDSYNEKWKLRYGGLTSEGGYFRQKPW